MKNIKKGSVLCLNDSNLEKTKYKILKIKNNIAYCTRIENGKLVSSQEEGTYLIRTEDLKYKNINVLYIRCKNKILDNVTEDLIKQKQEYEEKNTKTYYNIRFPYEKIGLKFGEFAFLTPPYYKNEPCSLLYNYLSQKSIITDPVIIKLIYKSKYLYIIANYTRTVMKNVINWKNKTPIIEKKLYLAFEDVTLL